MIAAISGFVLDRYLRLETKIMIHQVCALSMLLYSSECWIGILRKHVRKTAAMKVTKHRLEWLRHLAHMPDHKNPQICPVWLANLA